MRISCRRVVCLLLVVGALGVPCAVAAPLRDPDTEAAKRHSDRGATFYAQERYADAVREFEAARKIKPLAALDFNIARAHERLEAWGAAADAYERYAKSLRDAGKAGEIRARVAVLRARVAEPSPPAPALAAPSPVVLTPTIAPALPVVESATPKPRYRLATWALGIGGAAFLVGSVVAGIIANNRYSYLSGHCGPSGACDLATVPDVQSQVDNGRAAASASNAFLGVGLAAVAAGTVLFVLDARRGAYRRGWMLAPTASMHGAGLTFEVTR